MDVHQLKIYPEYFQQVVDGAKTFELRKNDRNYKVGDLLQLNEYQIDAGYTGRKTVRQISYVLEGSDVEHLGLRKGFCILALTNSKDI